MKSEELIGQTLVLTNALNENSHVTICALNGRCKQGYSFICEFGNDYVELILTCLRSNGCYAWDEYYFVYDL